MPPRLALTMMGIGAVSRTGTTVEEDEEKEDEEDDSIVAAEDEEASVVEAFPRAIPSL